MNCPLEEIDLALKKCPVEKCLYNENGGCRYAELKSLGGNSDGVTSTFNVTLDELRQSISRIKVLIYVDSFSQFILNKPLTLATREEIESLKEQESSYDTWVMRNPEINFERMVQYIRTALRILTQRKQPCQ